jgi:hypothetical protein
VTSARHRKVVEHSHRRLLQTAALAMVLAVLAAVGGAHGSRQAPAQRKVQTASAPARPALLDRGTDDSPYQQDRLQEFSRSAERVTLRAKPKPKPKPKVTGHRYLGAPLNLWPAPREHGKPLTVLERGGRVDVTGVRRAGFAQVVRSGHLRWVTAKYLTVHKPSAARSASSGGTGGAVLTSAPCASGSGMESGIVAQAVVLHRAVCSHFPQVRTYGGWRGDGEHSDGHAIDIMVYGDHATGQAIADWVRANAATLHVDDVIWSQHIWTTQRASEGWRMMPDRGSITANHYDHVHVRVF